MKRILSLYDFSAYILRPWAEAGYSCIAVDLLHSDAMRIEVFASGGSIEYLALDLHSRPAVEALFSAVAPVQVFAFPVCTELASSGARHWRAKAEANRYFQIEAIEPVLMIDELCRQSDIPYVFENPKGLLSTIWRKPDWTFSPYEYGGYLPESDCHPHFDIIPPRDAYTKETYIWAYKRTKPPIKPVPPRTVATAKGNYSPQYAFLGGKSLSTKLIRSATPRGFAQACFEHYRSLVDA